MSIINITITGPAGSGKTTIAHRIRNCVADMAFMAGGTPSQPVRVIIVDEGMTEQTFRRLVGDAPRVVVIRESDADLKAQREELLAALEAITNLYDADEGCRSLPEYKAARAAIVRAKGGAA